MHSKGAVTSPRVEGELLVKVKDPGQQEALESFGASIVERFEFDSESFPTFEATLKRYL